MARREIQMTTTPHRDSLGFARRGTLKMREKKESINLRCSFI